MTAPILRAVRPSQAVGYAYSIQRNSRGSLPVYSDIRNGGTRYQVLVKNIKGDINVCHSFSYVLALLSDFKTAGFQARSRKLSIPGRLRLSCTSKVGHETKQYANYYRRPLETQRSRVVAVERLLTFPLFISCPFSFATCTLSPSETIASHISVCFFRTASRMQLRPIDTAE